MNVKYKKEDILMMILDGFSNDFAIKTIQYIKENNLSKYSFMLKLETSLEDASFYDDYEYEFNVRSIKCNLSFDEFNLHFKYNFANDLKENVALFAKEVVGIVTNMMEEKESTNTQKYNLIN